MLDIALVSYINTRPFMDGLEHYFQEDEMRLHLLPPSACAAHLRQGKSHLALIPVGALLDFERIELLPNHCIGADGAVASVFLFSQCPLQDVKTVILDRHSRSSNGLARLLMAHHWKQSVSFVHPTDTHFHRIKDRTAGIVIGDKAISLRSRFPYAYDLAEAWKQLTGLPFVFAVWAYHPGKLQAPTRKRLDQAMQWGTAQALESAQKWASVFNIPLPFAREYLHTYIDFSFDAPKHRALRLYLNALAQLPPLPAPADAGMHASRSATT